MFPIPDPDFQFIEDSQRLKYLPAISILKGMTYSSRRYYSIVLLSFLFIVSVLSLPTPQGDATSKSPYDSGHDHGCNDADISDHMTGT